MPTVNLLQLQTVPPSPKLHRLKWRESGKEPPDHDRLMAQGHGSLAPPTPCLLAKGALVLEEAQPTLKQGEGTHSLFDSTFNCFELVGHNIHQLSVQGPCVAR